MDFYFKFFFFEALAFIITSQKTNLASVPPAVTTEVNKGIRVSIVGGAQTELVIELNISTVLTKNMKTVTATKCR